MSIQLNADRTIDIPSFLATEDDALGSWIAARLQGNDVVIPGGTIVDEDRHLAIAALYDKLDTDHQRRLRRVVLHHLNDAARGEPRGWSPDGIVQLLRLLELVARDSVDEPVAVRRILDLLNRQETTDVVRQRSLQTLVGMGFHLSEGFWRAQYRSAIFAATVLEGLGQESVRSALKFLAEVEWTPALEAAVIVLLPTWLEQNEPREVLNAYQCVEPQLAHQGRSVLRDLLGLPPVVGLTIFRDPAATYKPVTTIPHELSA